MSDGRLLVQSVLRPLAEHINAELQPRPGEVCVDVDRDALLGTRDELAVLHLGNLFLLRAHTAALPLREGCAHVVTSLFPHHAGAALPEMLRILHPQQGRLACALWTEHDGVVIAGRRIDTASLLTTPHTRLEAIADVARFDGVAHYQAATGSGASQDQLAPYTAPDGTLRIPTRTVTLCSP